MSNDSVVSNYFVKYNGTPEEVRQWILDNDPEFLDKIHDVLVGSTGQYVRIQTYLDMTAKKTA